MPFTPFNVNTFLTGKKVRLYRANIICNFSLTSWWEIWKDVISNLERFILDGRDLIRFRFLLIFMLLETSFTLSFRDRGSLWIALRYFLLLDIEDWIFKIIIFISPSFFFPFSLYLSISPYSLALSHILHHWYSCKCLTIR